MNHKSKSVKPLLSLTVILIGLLLLSNNSSAQTNVKPGYVITTSGDTLNGFIVTKTWEYNPTSIEFRNDKSIAGKVFSYNDIKEFKTEKEWYISSVFNVEVSPRLDNAINYDSTYKIQTDTGFLQVLQKGIKSLFYYHKKNSEVNLYIEADDKPELLLYKRFIRTTDFNIVVGELKDYKKQLEKYLDACPEVSALIEKALYSETFLFNIFKTYNQKCGTKPSFTRPADKIKINFSLTGGIQFTKLSFKPSNIGTTYYGALVLHDHQPSLAFTGGAAVTLTFQRGARRVSLYNEVNYGSYSSTWTKRIDGFSSTTYRMYDCDLAVGYIKLSNMLQYKIPAGNADLLIKGGLLNCFNIEQRNYQKEDAYFGTTVITTEGEILQQIKKWDPGFTAGIGIGLNRFVFELRYDGNKGASDYLSVGSRAKRVIFQAGFRL